MNSWLNQQLPTQQDLSALPQMDTGIENTYYIPASGSMAPGYEHPQAMQYDVYGSFNASNWPYVHVNNHAGPSQGIDA